jgi:hypothetical protein
MVSLSPPVPFPYGADTFAKIVTGDKSTLRTAGLRRHETKNGARKAPEL